MDMTTEKSVAETPGRVPAALKRFIWDIQSMVELTDSEREILVVGRDLMARLVANDDWLPPAFAAPNPSGGAQFHLYSDALERFTVVGTVLPPGLNLLVRQPQLWEIVGALRGTVSLRLPAPSGAPETQAPDPLRVLKAGGVDARTSRITEYTELSNVLADQVSISVHVYGGDVSKLSRCIPSTNASGEQTSFGYANSANAPPYDIYSIQTEILD